MTDVTTIANNYIDLFDFYTPEMFRAKNTERQQENKQKHLALTDFDREILKIAYQQIGSKECDLLHPMYQPTASYGHFGRTPVQLMISLSSGMNSNVTVGIGFALGAIAETQRSFPRATSVQSDTGHLLGS